MPLLKNLANLLDKKKKSSFVKLPKAVSKLSISLKNSKKLSVKSLVNLTLNKSLNTMSNSTNLIIPSIIIITLLSLKTKKMMSSMITNSKVSNLNLINIGNTLSTFLTMKSNSSPNFITQISPMNSSMFMMIKILVKLCSSITSTRILSLKLTAVSGICKEDFKSLNKKSGITLSISSTRLSSNLILKIRKKS